MLIMSNYWYFESSLQAVVKTYCDRIYNLFGPTKFIKAEVII